MKIVHFDILTKPAMIVTSKNNRMERENLKSKPLPSSAVAEKYNLLSPASHDLGQFT